MHRVAGAVEEAGSLSDLETLSGLRTATPYSEEPCLWMLDPEDE